MPLLLLFATTIAISYFAPKAANILAGILTFGLIIPFYTFAGGAFFWAISTLLNLHTPYIICCFLGLIIGSLITKFIIYSD